MKKIYLLTILFYFVFLGARAFDTQRFILAKIEIADSIRRLQRPVSKITDTRPNRPGKTDVKINITPFKPISNTKPAATASTSGSGSSAGTASSSTAGSAAPKNNAPDFKVLSNVKVYPNPADDQINISYSLSKETTITIKIMDVLGNEIATLLSQRLPAGEQNNNFSIGSRLNSGYYFIRLIAGNETVIKRISIL